MCGIVGGFGSIAWGSDTVHDSIVDSLSHRGPDDRGLWSNSEQQVWLGHRRLSIVDLSSDGRQPMFSEAGEVVVVVNGEIYNALMLRRELESLGHKFTSNSDSEVTVHGFEQWGTDLFRRLEGIFSIAIYDTVHRRLVLARDRFGVKPLYVWVSQGSLFFTSELKALKRHPNFRPKLSSDGIYSYLQYRFIPEPLSVWENVEKIKAGSFVCFDSNGYFESRYWSLPTVSDPTDGSRKAIVERLKHLLLSSVENQLMSDVPVGLLLSGGIDSSSLAWAMNEINTSDRIALVMGFEEHRDDERPYAHAVASHFGFHVLEEVMTEKRFFENIPEFIKMHDEPFFDYSSIFLGILSDRSAREGIKVLLGGDGGDELFVGYKWYDDFHLYGNHSDFDRYLSYYGCWLPGCHEALSSEHREFDPYHLLRTCSDPNLSNLDNVRRWDLELFLRDDVLTKADRASMRNGVEIRVPFLDTELASFALALPASAHFDGVKRKLLLKELLSGRVPDSILSNRKKGFGASIGLWCQSLRYLFEKYVSDGHTFSSGILDKRKVLAATQRDNSRQLWSLISLEFWLREQNKDTSWENDELFERGYIKAPSDRNQSIDSERYLAAVKKAELILNEPKMKKEQESAKPTGLSKREICPLCKSEKIVGLFAVPLDVFVPPNPTLDYERLKELGLHHLKEVTLNRCSNCSHVFSGELLNEEASRLFWSEVFQPAKSLAKSFRAIKKQLNLNRWQKIYSFFLEHYHNDSGECYVLDLGCGWGDFLFVAQSIGVKCYGVESDHRKIKFARERGLNVVESVEELPEAVRFDVFHCDQVIEHLEHPLDTIIEVIPKLKSTFIGYFGVPNYTNEKLNEIGRKLSQREPFQDKNLIPWDHLSYFSPESFGFFLSKLGMELFHPQNGSIVQPETSNLTSGFVRFSSPISNEVVSLSLTPSIDSVWLKPIAEKMVQEALRLGWKASYIYGNGALANELKSECKKSGIDISGIVETHAPNERISRASTFSPRNAVLSGPTQFLIGSLSYKESMMTELARQAGSGSASLSLVLPQE
jgi:asparagine synthase (glutamine-hydrolysing)